MMVLLGGILLLIILVMGALFAYLQMGTYHIAVPRETVKAYVAENMQEMLWIDDTEIEVVLEDTFINAWLHEFVGAQNEVLGKGMRIEGAMWDSRAERLCINGKLMGISVPLSFKPEIEQDDETLFVRVRDVALGSKHITLPSVLTDYVASMLEEGMVIEDDLLELIVLDTFEVDRDEWVITLELNERMLNKHMIALQPYIDREVVNTYREGGWLENTLVDCLEGNVEPTAMTSYLAQFYSSGLSLETYLALFTDEGVAYIEANYMQKIGCEVDKEKLEAKRTANAEAVLDRHAHDLIDIVYAYLDTAYIDYLVSNKGVLYDLLNDETITVGYLKDAGYIDTADTQYDVFCIVYTGMYGKVGVQYKKGTTQYIMWEDGVLETVDPLDVAAEVAFTSHYITASDNERTQVETAILDWYMVNDTLDIRYMKTDDKYVYTIYSFGDEWNDYYHAVLKKQQDNYDVVVTGSLYEVLYGLEDRALEFDYRLMPAGVATYKDDAYLTANDYEIIKEIIASHTGATIEELTLDYATMCDDVVYIKLVDGRRFYYFNTQDYLVELHEPNDYQREYDANVMYEGTFPTHSILQDDYIAGGV